MTDVVVNIERADSVQGSGSELREAHQTLLVFSGEIPPRCIYRKPVTGRSSDHPIQ